MIYSGSGSYFGKVWVPASVQFPVPDPDYLVRFFNIKKFVQKFAFSMLEAAFIS
jgi:hypothetical protein